MASEPRVEGTLIRFWQPYEYSSSVAQYLGRLVTPSMEGAGCSRDHTAEGL